MNLKATLICILLMHSFFWVAKSERKNPPVYEEPVGTTEEQAYVKRFLPTAKAEKEKFGIPVSIKLAQGILESGLGEGTLASKHNNHFGIKCFRKDCPRGHCVRHADDKPTDRFVKYKTAWESWRDHSKFLQKEHYLHLYEYGDDYVKWAKGLKAAGYATDPRYADKIIDIIQRLKLHRYDRD